MLKLNEATSYLTQNQNEHWMELNIGKPNLYKLSHKESWKSDNRQNLKKNNEFAMS